MAAIRRSGGGGWRLLVAALLLAAAAPGAAGAAEVAEAKNVPGKALPFRLTGDVLPSNYTIRIVTHFQDDNFRFYGQMLVDVDVVRDTREVRLHAKMLKVDPKSVTLVQINKKRRKKPPKEEPRPPAEDEDANEIPEPEVQQQESKPAQQGLQQQEAEPEKQEQQQQEPEPEQEQQQQQEQLQQEKEKEKEQQQEEQQQEPEQEKEQQQEEQQQQPEQEQQQEEEQQKEQEQGLQQEDKPAEENKPTEQGPQQEDKPAELEDKPAQQELQHEQLDEPIQQNLQQGESKPAQQDLQQEQPQHEQDKAAQPEQQQDDERPQEVQKEQQQQDKPTQELQDERNKTEEQQDEDQQTESRPSARAGLYQHTVGDASFRVVRLANVSTDAALEQLVVSPTRPLKAGARYRLSVRYWGTLNAEDRGYFRGSYQVGNQTRWVSSTVFEPAEARRAFPCFDEPHMKANFSLVLGRHANYSSSANMPLAATRPMDDTPGWFWDYYHATPKMSTYLVAFMVHSLEGSKLNDTRSSAAPIRAWATPGRAHMSNFSLSVAPQVLSMLEDRLGAPPALPKHDLVVVPGFRSEALENWGLVSFEERHLLLPGTAGQLSKQSVGTVVAHELAHIWFGNLVTPAWWSDIWLSEGFATYYSAEALDKIFPAWRFHETAAGNAFLLITSADASPASVPLVHPADNPSKLDSVFGAISYFKGYWMLRMLQSILGPQVFDAGVRDYVRRNLYSSVRTQDLWDAMQGAVDKRAEDLLAAAASQAEDVVVVSDGSEDDDLARVVVPSAVRDASSGIPLTTPAGLVTPDTSPTAPGNNSTTPSAAEASGERIKRDLDQIPLLGSLALGIADPSDNKDSREIPDHQDGRNDDAEKPAPVDDAAQQPDTRAAGDGSAPDKNVPVEDNKKQSGVVQSPPRRGPGPTGFTGKVGWLPRPVDQVMRSWVQQPGYPIINMYRNLDTGVVTLNQRRFVSGGGGGVVAPCNASSATWWVPMRYATSRTGAGAGAATGDVFWMPPTCGNVTLPVKVARDDWVVLNAGLAGLFRVRYDARTLQLLSRLPRAAWLQVAPLSRLQLVADSLDLARQGRAPYQQALRMANHIGRDTNPMVWRAALPHLLMLQRQLRGRRDAVALRFWLQDLVSPHAPNVGFTSRAQDSPQQASLRVKVTTLACHADHSSCQRKAKKALKLFMGGDTDAIVAGRLTHTQLCAAVRWGSPADWRFLRAQLANPSSSLPRKAVVTALGCSRDQETLRSLLADTVSANSTLRRSDVAGVLSAVAANEVGGDLTLRFMEEQAAELYKRLGDHPAKVEKAVREVATAFNSQRQLDRLDAVLRQYQSRTPSRSPPTWGHDVVRENMRWVERSRGEVSRWLRARLDIDDELELKSTPSKNKDAAASKGSSASAGAKVGAPGPKATLSAAGPKLPPSAPGPKLSPSAAGSKVSSSSE